MQPDIRTSQRCFHQDQLRPASCRVWIWNPPTLKWPHPRAGARPVGDDRVLVMIDAIGWYGRYPPPGVWGLYTYWPDMKISADGHYWGNVMSAAKPEPIARGKWTCVELMIQLNSSPDKHD